MILRQVSFRYLLAAALLFGLWGTAHAATAADGVSTADLQAAARALGFLETLPDDGIVVIGIIYSAEVPYQKILAAKVAERLNVIPGPNSAHFRTEIIALDDLTSFANRLDGIFLLPGVLAEKTAITEVLRPRHLVSISNDPAYVDANCCVLMIRSGRRVEIILNTQLANAAGLHFSSVFTMMVKRK